MSLERFSYSGNSTKGLINELQCAQQILVGFSGGLDSTVLLNLLTEVVAAERITAVHINHGLSSQADQWQEHAQRQCKALGVAYHGETVKVISAGGGLEEAARNLRYQVFERLLVEGGILLLGHHQNDQAETVLYRLMRGSGPRGNAQHQRFFDQLKHFLRTSGYCLFREAFVG